VKHRLLTPELKEQPAELDGQPVTLGADQAHYVARVLRLRTGETVALFDGAGREWRATLGTVTGNRADAVIESLARREPAPTPLLLVQAWLKGSAMDTVVQKATELGATGIRLLSSERSAVRHGPERAMRRLNHLQRVAVSATQQCESLWLPELSSCDSLDRALTTAATSAATEAPLRIMLDPGRPPLDAGSRQRPLQLLVGPEGGWTDGERRQAVDAGVTLQGLGELVLRAETVPLAALAAVRHAWGWRR
jgi:16S rRNA (uracil1498-N3)-methyltransferase